MTWKLVFLIIAIQYGSMFIYYYWKDYILPDLQSKRKSKINK